MKMLYEDLTEEHRDLAEMVRKIAHEKIAPMVRDLERKRKFSPELRDLLAQAGLMGIVVPEEFGGVETDLWSEVIVLEELSKVFPTASTYLTAHWFATKLMVRAAQLSPAPDYLLDLIKKAAIGESLGAIAASEPGVGSDLGGVVTRATLDGDEWVINGSKRWITNGGFADFYAVVARTGVPGPRGVSVFIVEGDRPGVVTERHEEKMGLHASATAEMLFENVRVPRDHVLLDVDKGFGLLMEGFDEGRVTVGALSLGIAEGALDASIRYAGEREQFGQLIASYQGLQFLLADMAIAVHTARAIVYDAARAVVTKNPNAARLASIAKTYASDTAMQVTTDAVQVHGGYGYSVEFPVEMLMRDAKINQIYEGTNQIQRMLIARTYYPDLR
jgi:alkylation response protein AidB-like acyl-CoA dehydrogenase